MTNGPSEGTMSFRQHPGLRSASQEPREVEWAALLLYQKEKEKKIMQLYCLGLYNHGCFYSLDFLGISTYL